MPNFVQQITIHKIHSYIRLLGAFWCSLFGKFFLLGSVFFLSATYSLAQSNQEEEEVSIFLNVQRLGATELPAVIRGESAWLSLADLFNFLKIRYELSKSGDSLSGTFINATENYMIDLSHQRIIYGTKEYKLKQGALIKTATGLFLQSDYFGEIFGLQCQFNFRNLSIVLSTELELPVLREVRQEQMRNNLSKLSGVFKADTIVKRNYPLFYFGAADYNVIASTGDKVTPGDVKLGLGLGGMIAGGETNVVLNYRNHTSFSGRQQYYLWRYVDNDLPYARQFLAGKIQAQSISSIYAPVIGIQVTNAPTSYRRSFGSYTLSNHTEPNWTVELYVNGVLINYVKADVAGFYTFNVPLVYGNTMIKLRFYGPYGEERSTEQHINIPFNFLPEKEFEYTASSGIIEDGNHTRFARLSTNYGLARNITIGGGLEYLSSITSGSRIPFVNTSVRLLPNLLFSAEYDHDVRTKAVLSYNLLSGLQIEINNTWYKKGQMAINNTFVENRKAMFSFPFRGRHFSAYTRFSVEQILLANTRYTLANWMLSGVVGNVSASATTYSVFMKEASPYVYTNYSVSLRMLKSLLITPQLQYEYLQSRVIGIKTELEKRVFRSGYMNLTYEKNFLSNINILELGLRYDFSFAQSRIAVRRSNDVIRTVQGISGSLLHDGKSRITQFNNYTSVGKGAVLLIPYLDMNGNNRRDKDEPGAQGLKIKINGGRIQQLLKDTTILITDLEPYTNYHIELDGSGFEHLAWKFPKKNYSIVIDPNFIKNMEVPVAVFGEASGRIILRNGEDEKGASGITVNFYNRKGILIGQTMSEIDGYFAYLGFLPGGYFMRVDSVQLKAMDLYVERSEIPFVITRNIDGDLVNQLNLLLKPLPKAVPTKLVEQGVPALPEIRSIPLLPLKVIIPLKQSVSSIVHTREIHKKEATDSKDSLYRVQTARFKYPMALVCQRMLSKHYRNVVIVPAKGPYYNIQILGIKDKSEARRIIKRISLLGFPKAYILN